MTNISSNQQELIQAAGGLLWRRSPSGMEIASSIGTVTMIGHYQGKLQEGESWSEAAAREVREETATTPLPRVRGRDRLRDKQRTQARPLPAHASYGRVQ